MSTQYLCPECGEPVKNDSTPCPECATANRFSQEYGCIPDGNPAPPKIGDIASNFYTGHRGKIVEVKKRADGRVWATLDSGASCVLPSQNWEVHRQNASLSHGEGGKKS